MKSAERGIYRIISVILLVVFLPVLFCVFFIGNKMNYTELMKPSLPVPNALILLIALPIIAAAVYLVYLGAKHPLKKKGNIILTVVMALLCIGLYFLSVKIAREIVFYLPWDVDVVMGSAMKFAKDEPLGYDFYYSVYTNNIPIVYVLGKILKFATDHHYPLNTSFAWVHTACVLMTAAVFFLTMTVKRLTGNLYATIISFVLSFVLIGLSAWKIAPYTDSYGQLFPILGIYLYVCYRQSEKKVLKYILLALCVAVLAFGGMIKPNLYLLFIALFLAELLNLISNAKENLQFFIASILFLMAAFFATKLIAKSRPAKLGLEVNYNIEAGVPEYFYMGLNEEQTGSYNNNDVAIYGEFQEVPKAERDRIIWGRAKDRIKEKGAAGLLYFWLRKMTMTFNDGAFGWNCEVWINKHYEPIVSSNSALMDKLRSVYWFGPNSGKYGALCQLFWFVVLLGIPGCVLAIGKKKPSPYCGILMISFLGIFFYQMLFEARARYLFVFLPLIIALSVSGISEYSALLAKLFLKKKKGGGK